ncbi:MAG: hypothetical protein GY852_02085 [bacterium]|nr:hypothetical protein [bacterium]
MQDISQGRRPQGVTAAEALETLQESANTRIRLKERNLETALERLTKLVTSRMLQFVRTPRVVKITGKEGWPEMFEFTMKDVITEEGDRIQVDKQPFTFDPEAKKFNKGEFQQGEPTKGLFDIKVNAGTSLPFQKAQRGNLALRLRENQDLSREGLFSALDWPEKEEELRRLEKEDERRMQQEQAQGGA